MGTKRSAAAAGAALLAVLALLALTAGLAVFLGPLGAARAAAPACLPGVPGPVAFGYTGGEVCYTVGAGVASVHVRVIGAAGGGPAGTAGRGASVTADLAVTPGETLYVEVGGGGLDGGFNGGGTRIGVGSGGGASDVRTCALPCATTPPTGQPGDDPRLVVAGGGGGGGGQNGPSAVGGVGGDGGRDGGAGLDGLGSNGAGGGGGGATQSVGGPGGASGGGGAGLTGTVGGGAPAPMSEGTNGGAGGGGWFGGGSGGAAGGGTDTAGGGGGAGSSFGPAGSVFGVSSSPAQVTITAPSTPAAPTPTPPDTAANPTPSQSAPAPPAQPQSATVPAASPPPKPRAHQPATTTSIPSSSPPPSPAPAAGSATAAPTPLVPGLPAAAVPGVPRPGPAVGPSRPAASPRPGPTGPGPAATAGRPHGRVRYDPRSEPRKVVGLGVVAYTLLELGAGGGLALAGLAGAELGGAGLGGRGGKGPGGGSIASASVEHLAGGLEDLAPGDRSRTWRWPGTARLDGLSLALPGRLATRTPLGARLVADGSYLRSMLGSASIVLYPTGLVLGAAAVADAGGHALPPSTLVTFAAIVLGVLDAGAGFVAVLTFFAGVGLLGGIDSLAALRTMLGLGAVWFVVPLLAGAARPLRRAPAASPGERVDRAADIVIASLIGAWAVSKIISGLPGLAGYELPIAAHADAAALVVLAAVGVRLAAESAAIRYYPERLAAVQAVGLRGPGPVQRLGVVVLRTAIFLLVATVVVGSSWQLWVGTALFAGPQILSVYEERLPRIKGLHRALPRGLLKLVLMLFVGTAVGAVVTDSLHGSSTIIGDSFVLLALPGLALTLLGMVGRGGEDPPIRWRDRGVGIVLLGAGLALVLGYVSI